MSMYILFIFDFTSYGGWPPLNKPPLCIKSTAVQTRNDEKKSRIITDPDGIRTRIPRLSRPGSLTNSPTEVPEVIDNFKPSHYVNT